MVMRMGESRTQASDIALSELAGAVEEEKEGGKDYGMCSTSSTWRLGILTTQATRL